MPVIPTDRTDADHHNTGRANTNIFNADADTKYITTWTQMDLDGNNLGASVTTALETTNRHRSPQRASSMSTTTLKGRPCMSRSVTPT